MISICIPVYNYHVTNLITTLSNQIELLNEGLELIVIDDGSKEEFKLQNRDCLTKHVYIELPQNIGRSKVRNLFNKYAKNKFLLFMDCDSMVVNHQFLANYMTCLENDTVFYGGRNYPKKLPNKNEKLSWIYGSEIESKSVSQRNKLPYVSFMTNNFLIDRSIFFKICFDEKLKNYGHEDTLFGYQLYQSKIIVKHIDNPVLNLDLESNKKFIEKTEQALCSLRLICSEMKLDNEFFEYVKLLRFYKTTTKLQSLAIQLTYGITNRVIRCLLVKGLYSNNLLGFYKIGYFMCINKKMN